MHRRDNHAPSRSRHGAKGIVPGGAALAVDRFERPGSLAGPLAKALEAPVLPFTGKKSMSHTLKLCSVKELKSVFGIPYSRQHIWRMIGEGRFPHAVKLGQCRVAFRCSNVEEWIQDRIAETTRQGELPL